MANTNISMKDLHSKLNSLGSKDLIVDVRSADEFGSGHIQGSRNIPHDQVGKHAEELKKYKTVYIHCQAGGRAGRACQALEKLGLTNLVCISDSGMGDWIASGFPVVK
ncbi:MAG: rhodanese-like domain-containing protein [Bdellovibrionia bacterium]